MNVKNRLYLIEILTNNNIRKNWKKKGNGLTTFTVALGTFPTEIGCRFMIDPFAEKESRMYRIRPRN